MKMIRLLLLAVSLLPACIQAQVSQTYTFSSSVGVYTPISGTSLIGPGVTFDDNLMTVSLPSPISFDGTNYSALWVSANGWISLASISSMSYNVLNSSVTTPGVIAPLSADLRSAYIGSSNISWMQNSTETVVQWTDMMFYFGSIASHGLFSFQAHINNTTGEINFVYKTDSIPAALLTCQVGMKGPDNLSANVNCVTTPSGSAGDWLTILSNVNTSASNCHFHLQNGNVPTAYPATGTTLTWSYLGGGSGSSCFAPGNITSSVSGTTATISFPNTSFADSFNVEYGPASVFTVPTGTPAFTVDTNTFDLTGLIPGSSYRVFVQRVCSGGALSGYSSYVFVVPGSPPSNDDCLNAIPISCGGGVVTGTTVNATVDAVPSCATASQYKGVWYTLVGNNDSVTITTCDASTDFDTWLSVYSGSCGNLNCLVNNDDYSGCSTAPLRSRVSFLALAGTTYYVYIHGFSSQTGNFGLDITCDAIDCEAIFSASVNNANVNFTNNSIVLTGTPSYTWDFGDGSPSDNSSNPSHVYTQSGVYTVSLNVDNGQGCNETFTSTVSIYCITAFETQFTYSLNGNVLSLTDATTGGANFWEWYMTGNGSSYNSSTQNPSFTLLQPGSYELFLYSATDTTGMCWDSSYQVIGITFTDQDTISGSIFNDVNGNGVLDLGETAITGNVTVFHPASGGSFNTMTDGNGFYTTVVASGSYEVNCYNAVPAGYSQTLPVSPDYYSLSLIGNTNTPNVDFGLQNTSAFVTGVVFHDFNNNGIQDTGEPGVSNQMVNIGNMVVSTNYNGLYYAIVAAGNYNVSYTPAGNYFGYSISSTPATYNVVAVMGNTYGGNDFGIWSPYNQCNLSVSLTPFTNVSPIGPVWYHVNVQNVGTAPVTASTLEMFYDPSFSFNDNTPTTYVATDDVVNHILTWTLPNINPGSSINMTVRFFNPTTLQVNDAVFNLVIVTPVGCTDSLFSNNIDSLHQLAQASWDPNEKSVQPMGIGAVGAIDPGQPLSYTVHFQNTGNYPAMNVRLLDQLDADLDWSTFQMIGSSHPCHTELDMGTGLITFYFNGIMLPDSVHNEPASHGFVRYSIQPLPNLPQGKAITNSADIYFDYNDAVTTNTTTNTIDYFLHLEVAESEMTSISVVPNPFNNEAQIFADGIANEHTLLLVIDMNGRVVRSVSEATPSRLIIHKGDLSEGVYYFQLIQSNNTVGQGKLVVF